MSYLVEAADAETLDLRPATTVEEVLRNVAIILATAKGSVPLYRDFGLSQEYLDKPLPVAKAMLVSSVKEAVEDFEPRASVKDIRFTGSAAEPASLAPVVEIEIVNE